ncbi:MAG: hypothetical protein HQ527_03815 [Cyanobacteria bacterium]|nr:hypothetical protein [Cyanobacteria bacterium bin.51]
MSLNRTAKGIVLVPSLLLGGAFLSAGVWLQGEAAANRPLALALGGLLLAAGLLTQLLPESPQASPELTKGQSEQNSPTEESQP